MHKENLYFDDFALDDHVIRDPARALRRDWGKQDPLPTEEFQMVLQHIVEADVVVGDIPLPCVVPVKGIKAEHIDLAHVHRGDGVVLRAEPDNAADPHAVQVVHEATGRKIGYIPAHLAERIPRPVRITAMVESVLDFEGYPAGIRLLLMPQEG